MGFLLGVIIGLSLVKPDGDELGCLLGRILVIVPNTEVRNSEGFSLYWASNTCMWTGGGWFVPNGDGDEIYNGRIRWGLWEWHTRVEDIMQYWTTGRPITWSNYLVHTWNMGWGVISLNRSNQTWQTSCGLYCMNSCLFIGFCTSNIYLSYRAMNPESDLPWDWGG